MGSGRALKSLVFGCLLVFAVPAAALAAEVIALAESGGAGGWRCPQAEGVYVALLVPSKGTVLISTRPFPGGQRVGSVEGDRLRFSLPDVGAEELQLTSSASSSIPIWGMADRSLEVGARTGCFSFGQRDFTTVDDLKTYLHWALREVFFRLRVDTDPEPLALRLADRAVTLEISAPGHRPARVRVREAGLAGLRLPDAESVYYFQPLILDEASGRLAVKVLRKAGPFFGAGTASEVAFVIAGRHAPGVTPTEPMLEIRTAAIE